MVYFSFRKTTLRYVYPLGIFGHHWSLLFTVYFHIYLLIYFLVYLESGAGDSKFWNLDWNLDMKLDLSLTWKVFWSVFFYSYSMQPNCADIITRSLIYSQVSWVHKKRILLCVRCMHAYFKKLSVLCKPVKLTYSKYIKIAWWL